jgi:hypothetical protein
MEDFINSGPKTQKESETFKDTVMDVQCNGITADITDYKDTPDGIRFKELQTKIRAMSSRPLTEEQIKELEKRFELPPRGGRKRKSVKKRKSLRKRLKSKSKSKSKNARK